MSFSSDLLFFIAVPEVHVAREIAKAAQREKPPVRRPADHIPMRVPEGVDLLRLQVI